MQPAAPSLPPRYGPQLTLAQAKRVLAAAEAEAVARAWPMVIAIVDGAGQLVLFSRLDQAQVGSVAIAQQKAATAALFRRPTKVFQDAIAEGGLGLRLLSMEGVCALEGGVPLLVAGEVVGAIGVSGMRSDQDGEVAAAGARALAG